MVPQIAEQVAPIKITKNTNGGKNDACDETVIDRHQAWLWYQSKKAWKLTHEITIKKFSYY